MSTDSQLGAFLQRAKEHALSDEIVVAMLRQNGWSERRIYRAYAELYETELGMPVPGRPNQSGGARDAFLYLLNFITLGFWALGLGQIFYILIAHQFPDATQLSFGGDLRDQISWQIATVIVAFPVFIFVHLFINRELKTRVDLYDSGIRRWLTYIALVIAAFIVITDCVWFIEALIRGELTIRFVLDSIVLFVIGGGIFSYYLATMDPRTGPRNAA